MTDETSEIQQNQAVGGGPVLVAIDFGPDSEAALVWACGFAHCVEAGLAVLHVVHDPGDAPGYYRKGEQDLLRPMEDVAAEMLEQFLEDFAENHPDLEAIKSAQQVLVKGIPPTRILEIAKTKDARLIVMGSRGRTGLPHLLLGSKAQRVVQMSPIPVTIVKSAANNG